ncbi:MAG: DUF1385 domain-containing protein [Deltaproteobacteria bacterium]|nr:DUF1385 domain-containing protein [Deltaproteobacteria bacterium]
MMPVRPLGRPHRYNPEGAMGVIAVKDENGKLLNVGGQAVIEGVMMRSPNSFAVCLRAPDGRIVLREDRWHSVWKRWKALRWPFFRGVIVLVEAMRNGINSLSFSAKWASSEDDNGAKNDEKPPETDPENPDTGISEWALVATMFVSFGFAIGLFVVLPHALTALLGFSTESWMFHAIDGVIKVAFLVGYIGLIGLMPDIKRVFQYHGAEHMAISTYEADLPLSVEHARKFTTFHPRCGTSFLFFVVAVSILVFSAIFPFLPQLPDWPKILRNIAYIGIKIPLMLPIAGISYEIIRLAGRRQENVLMRAVSQPGIWLQHLTTRRPTDDQLEVALLSLRKCLWRENIVEVSEEKVTEAGVRLYGSFQEASQAIQLAH